MSAILYHVLSHYLKDLSFENPGGPEALTPEQMPQVEFEMAASVRHGGPIARRQIELTLTVTARHASRAIFLCEITYVVLVALNTPDFRPELVAVEIPQTEILPLVAPLLNGMVQAGGYPGLHLHDLNFLPDPSPVAPDSP